MNQMAFVCRIAMKRGEESLIKKINSNWNLSALAKEDAARKRLKKPSSISVFRLFPGEENDSNASRGTSVHDCKRRMHEQ